MRSVITGVRYRIRVRYTIARQWFCVTGTYLSARCIYGDVSNATGPNGLQAANTSDGFFKIPWNRDVPL